MKKSMLMFAAVGRMAAVLALVLTATLQTAWADGCRTEEEKATAVQMRKAEDSERSGKLKAAYALLGEIDDMCLVGDAGKRYPSMRKRIGLQLGQQEEKQNRLGAAFDWYKDSNNDDEADRVKMKQVNASSRDRSLVSDAIDYFRFRGSDARMVARVAELRQLAAKNADLELAAEDKAFAARNESFQELGNVRGWLELVGDDAEKKARERAEQRGDALFKENIVRHLENAKSYFSLANAKKKEKALKEKALRLGQAAEKRGENNQAASFYDLADESDKGNALKERADAENQKVEEKRQKKFSKDQGALEKELGL